MSNKHMLIAGIVIFALLVVGSIIATASFIVGSGPSDYSPAQGTDAPVAHVVLVAGEGADMNSGSVQISEEQAKSVALRAFSGRVTDIKTKRFNGQPVYEVEITNGDGQAEVMVDMVSGTVVRVEQESIDDDDNYDDNVRSLSDPEITKEQAIEIALREVQGKVTDIEIERKMGRDVYAVEIDEDGDEVDVFVDVKTGEVVGTERDSDED